MNYEEEELLWSMSKTTKKLIEWYEQVLKYDLEDGDGLENEIRKEVEELERIFQYLDSILNGSENPDRDHIEKLMTEERKAEKLSRALEEKFQDDKLQMAGRRGLEYIEALEELTETYVDYEKVVEKRRKKTDSDTRSKFTFSTSNADYILTFQRHSRIVKMPDTIYEKSDCLVLENAAPHQDQTPPVDSELDPEEVNANQGVMCKNLSRDQKPVFTADIPPKNLDMGFGKDLEDQDLKAQVEIWMNKIGGIGSYWSLAVGTFGIGAAAAQPAMLSLSFLPMSVAALLIVTRIVEGTGADIDTGSLSLLQLHTPSVARSAAIAEKLDRFIAPKMKKEKGGKPAVFVNYGQGHQDIKMFLKNPKLREIVLELHKAAEFPFLDNSSKNLVTEFRFGPDGEHYLEAACEDQKVKTRWSKQLHDTGLI